MRCQPEALMLAQQACAATQDKRPEMLETLAAAYEANGRHLPQPK
jgi:hypothetical protein